MKRGFIICTLHMVLQDDETKENEMGDAYNTHGEAEKGVRSLGS
jgi:hypothetical protein